MKETILKALEARFPGVSADKLNGIADKLAKTVTNVEDVQTAVDGVTFDQLLTSYGDARATGAQQTAVANYEKKHGLKEGKPIEPPTPPTPSPTTPMPNGNNTPPTPTDPSVAALIAEVKALKDLMTANEAKTIAEQRAKQVQDAVAKLPESVRAIYGYADTSKMTNDEFTAHLAAITASAETVSKDLESIGAVFGAPNPAPGAGGRGKTATEAEVKAVLGV